ncbi:hypothetical protein S7711_00762 [Stachybotrys chartarum IBT 7711]|uniref:Uncharacterized protein n=1 Tax=Stachybotrys chartarum (strain CBS 109288 / IBT 7711) TaxID=1280523 RepID=A0A084B041_STACB|nr:hypothetical protein S7711_00762 [Stachybotrys chartarum IBT 7711]KFA49521.1 hypothetical protein S40293_02822 [Stachybotrys chartarum IBT 40293]
MALLNPVYAFMVPFLFVVTVPLAICAGITSTLAFSVLIVRVIAVYIDIALSLVPKSLLGRSRSRTLTHYRRAASTRPSSAHSDDPSPALTPVRRRRRRPSSVSIRSGSTTPVGDGGLGLIPSVGPERDFEGIGGWRVPQGDDTTWTAIHSRLELPDRQHFGRHHQRSASSGGPVTPGEGSYLMMKSRRRSPEAKAFKRSVSPNSSRVRTPNGHLALTGYGGSDGYFPSGATPKAVRKTAAQGPE